MESPVDCPFHVLYSIHKLLVVVPSSASMAFVRPFPFPFPSLPHLPPHLLSPSPHHLLSPHHPPPSPHPYHHAQDSPPNSSSLVSSAMHSQPTTRSSELTDHGACFRQVGSGGERRWRRRGRRRRMRSNYNLRGNGNGSGSGSGNVRGGDGWEERGKRVGGRWSGMKKDSRGTVYARWWRWQRLKKDPHDVDVSYAAQTRSAHANETVHGSTFRSGKEALHVHCQHRGRERRRVRNVVGRGWLVGGREGRGLVRWSCGCCSVSRGRRLSLGLGRARRGRRCGSRL